MVHIFEPPLRAPNPIGEDSKLRPGQKRKRDAGSDASETTSGQPNKTQGAANLDDSDGDDPAPSEAEADVEADDLPAHFPHAPERSDAAHARLSTPHRNVKRQHFHVLNAILHRSLLDHDYARAGRAMAYLLRFELAGRRVDLRKNGLWGIGAEILLQKPDASQRARDENLPTTDPDVQTFSQAGFQAARQYYARLILQYPSQKHRPADINAEHFYPAYFSLWTLEVQAQSQRARTELDDHRAEDSLDLSMETMSVESTDSDYDHRKRLAREKRIRTTELERARQIAVSLRDLTISPPYDRDVSLLKLQGRIACWMLDLLKYTSTDDDPEIADLQEVASENFERAQAFGAQLYEDEVERIAAPTERTMSPSF